MTVPTPAEHDPVLDAVETATDAVTALTDKVERHARRQRLANLLLAVAVLLLAIGVGLGAKILSRQGCINGVNDQRANDTRAFVAAEYQKVNNQYVGFAALRDAGKDRAKALGGYDTMLKATKAYRDSDVIKGRLKAYGVTIVHHADGTVTTVVPKHELTAGCS